MNKFGIYIGMRATAKEWKDAYQPGFLKTYGWHFYQFYGRASQAESYASEVNTKNGIVPINGEETITYVGGGVWDVR